MIYVKDFGMIAKHIYDNIYIYWEYMQITDGVSLSQVYAFLVGFMSFSIQIFNQWRDDDIKCF